VTISEAEKIDIVALSPDGTLAKLVIADHLEWDDVEAHCLLLQAKFNAYIAFVESGQMRSMEDPRIPDDAQVQIVIRAKHAPPPDAEAFLRAAGSILATVGLALVVDYRGDR
jgi:hypothetical protein